MTYVFDIDETICTSPLLEGTDLPDYDKAEPFVDRIALINNLYDEGNKIIFQTARGMGRSDNSSAYAYKVFFDLTKQQLDSWGIKYHSLFLGKPDGDVYIDDKAMRDVDFFTTMENARK